MSAKIKIAACQTRDVHEDIAGQLDTLEALTAKATAEGANIVLFPEGFLQGYLTKEEPARRLALDLSSADFTQILHRLAKLEPIIVFGLIEKEADTLFNTAVVIHHGQLLGRYRKTHLLPGESIFQAGNSYPIFDANGLKFGINICYDMQFPEAAQAVADQGADIILCPANNMMRRENAEKWKHRHHEMRIQRAKETNCWIVSADVTGERDGRIGYGPTSVISPEGKVVAQVPLLQEGLITQPLPSHASDNNQSPPPQSQTNHPTAPHRETPK